MERLLPDPGDVDDLYDDLVLPAAWLALGMVTSLDGATAVDGSSRALGDDGDLAAFRALRTLPDVVVVGLGTAVAEDYRASWPVRRAEQRARRGQAPLPRLALVTGSGEVPADMQALDDPDRPPLVLTTAAGGAVARDRCGGRAEVVELPGEEHVDPRALRSSLRERGLHRVLCEGGPTLNHALVAAGVVDHVFVTVAPTLVGGGTGIVGPTLPGGPVELELAGLRHHAGELLCHYRVATAG